jgi:hypothetical protein
VQKILVQLVVEQILLFHDVMRADHLVAGIRFVAVVVRQPGPVPEKVKTNASFSAVCHESRS